MLMEETTANAHAHTPANVQLSLKNIYRLLSMQDYPLPSPSVFPPTAWRGVTVVSFWHDILRSSLPPEIPLDMFNTNERRSRALSVLLGGTGGAGFRKKLFAILSANLTPDLLLSMTITWMTFLKDGQYSPSALNNRLSAFVKMLETGISPEITYVTHLTALMNEQQSCDEQTFILPLFQHGLLMAWLTLFALYIARSDDPALHALCMNGAASPATLYDRYIIQSRAGKLHDITNRHCTLCIAPVQPQAYIGHSLLLKEAAERLQTHGKLLISGIGGSGKSEFARQLLRYVSRSGCYDRAAYVQYSGSLAASFRKAFPALSAKNADGVIEECRNLLEKPSISRTLLLIDDLNQTPSEDAALAQLCAYGCDVLITSRLAALERFDVLPLPPLSPGDSQKLFRIHIRHSSAAQEEALAQLCACVQGHPLSLILFAGLCRSKYWSISKLLDHLKTNGLQGLSFVRGGVRISIPDRFSAAFNSAVLPLQAGRLLQLIARLPCAFYLPGDLAESAREIMPGQDELCNALQLLADHGWLHQSPQGYQMHPMIAATLHLTSAR